MGVSSTLKNNSKKLFSNNKCTHENLFSESCENQWRKWIIYIDWKSQFSNLTSGLYVLVGPIVNKKQKNKMQC